MEVKIARVIESDEISRKQHTQALTTLCTLTHTRTPSAGLSFWGSCMHLS